MSIPIPNQVALTAGAALVALLAACGASESPAAGATAPAEQGGGDTKLVKYTDARFHYSIEAPGQMASQPDGSARVVGPSERLEVAVVTPPSSDLKTLAQSDVSQLATAAAAFHLIAKPAEGSLGGHRAVRFTYTWNAGTSPVTGKPIDLTSVRYYFPKDAATAAVITYGVITKDFDPQGADDIAKTFRWL